jgi:hypothetical protein
MQRNMHGVITYSGAYEAGIWTLSATVSANRVCEDGPRHPARVDARHLGREGRPVSVHPVFCRRDCHMRDVVASIRPLQIALPQKKDDAAYRGTLRLTYSSMHQV